MYRQNHRLVTRPRGSRSVLFFICVVEYLFNDISAVVASIDDIPDATVRQQFQMVYDNDACCSVS